MGRLAASGYVSQVDDGHKWPGFKVTPLGLEAIREHMQNRTPKREARYEETAE
jgi:hypothetical protein